MGRRPDGPERVEKLEGSDEAKRRARVVLEAIAGRLGVDDAAHELGLSTTRFEEIREAFLSGGLAALEPKAPGRPPIVVSEEERRIAELQEEVRELKEKLLISHVKEELAIGLPLLGKRGKKGG